MIPRGNRCPDSNRKLINDAFKRYEANLNILKTAKDQDLSNSFVIDGLRFIYSRQFEFAISLFQSLLTFKGDIASASELPRGIIKATYRYFDAMDEDLWLEMLRNRSRARYPYDEQSTKKFAERIIETYIPEFLRTYEAFSQQYGEILTDQDSHLNEA